MKSKAVLSVTADIKAIVPDVLIEYLWKLALNDSSPANEEQLFILETGELNGRKVQDIYHAVDYGDSIDMRRIYGVEPINCNIQICVSNNGFQMQLFD